MATLYIGITSDLETRIREHRNGSYGGFTSEYKVNRRSTTNNSNGLR